MNEAYDIKSENFLSPVSALPSLESFEEVYSEVFVKNQTKS